MHRASPAKRWYLTHSIDNDVQRISGAPELLRGNRGVFTLRSPRVATVVAVLLALLLCFNAVGMDGRFRPRQTYRTISTASYDMIFHRGGPISVNLRTGEPIFEMAFPMVWLEGEDSPKRLSVDGRWSMRDIVRDALGEGQGMTLRRQDCEWSIRTYPTQPFFGVQVAYINTGRRPVQVRALIPWATGAPGRGSMSMGHGAENTMILTQPLDRPSPELVQDNAESQWNLAAHNPATGRSIIAGFLTNDHSTTRIEMARGDNPEPYEFKHFRAACVFDPPVTVEPGEQLVSEVFYVAITEPNPLTGLERYGHAIAAAHRLPSRGDAVPAGWIALSGTDSAEELERRITALGDGLLAAGITHATIGPGWESGNDALEPARFSADAFRRLTRTAQDAGVTLGIAVDAFRAQPGDPRIDQYPGLFVQPDEAAGHVMDPAHPLMEQYLLSLTRRVFDDWGFYALVLPDGPDVLHTALVHRENGPKAVEAIRQCMQLLREAAGMDHIVVSGGALPLSAALARGVYFPETPVQDWSAAAQRYFYTPFLWTPIFDLSQRIPTPRDPAGQAALTGASLLSGTLKLGPEAINWNAADRTALRKVLPIPDRSARPVDLFDRNGPRIWSLPLRSPAGTTHVVALFNNNPDMSQTLTVPLRALDLDPSAYHTVFGFWEEQYHGTVRDQLTVSVPAGGVRVFGLRTFQRRPMFVGAPHHLSQGTAELSDVRWSESTGHLEGHWRAERGRTYDLYFLAPSPYTLRDGQAYDVDYDLTQDDTVIRLRFTAERSGTVRWRLRFDR